MEFKINKKSYIASYGILKKFLDKKGAVFAEFKDDSIGIFTVNAYLSVTTEISDPEAGIFFFPGEQIIKICKATKGAFITVKRVSWGLEITTEEDAVFNLMCLRMEIYPSLPDGEFEFKGVLNLQSLKPLLSVKDIDKQYPLLIRDKTIVSTNRYVAHVFKSDFLFPDSLICKGELSKFPANLGDIAVFEKTGGGCQKFKYSRIEKEVKVWEIEVYADFNTDPLKYPFLSETEKIFEPFLAKKIEHIDVKKSSISQGTENLKKITGKEYSGSTLKYDGKNLNGEAENPDYGTAKVVPIASNCGYGVFTIMVNLKYLSSALCSIKDENIILSVSEEKNQIFLANTDYSHCVVIMGMRDLNKKKEEII